MALSPLLPSPRFNIRDLLILYLRSSSDTQILLDDEINLQPFNL